eukprot:Clim_evm16s2 gene=Clim_evmTU16s2
MAFQDALKQYEELKKEWSSGKDLKKTGTLLEELKIALMEVQYLPTEGEAKQQELLLAREVLEIGAQWGVASGDLDAFERYMAQLDTYYRDYAGQMPESAHMRHLQGLKLLYLLAKNRIADFHTELELLDPSLLQDNVYIKYPAQLERYLIEGSYNKILMASDKVPDPSYKSFLSTLTETIRVEIADCLEYAYDKMTKSDAQKVLFLDNKKDLEAIAASRNWTSSGTEYVFPPKEQTSGHVNPKQLQQQTLSYAKELERII